MKRSDKDILKVVATRKSLTGAIKMIKGQLPNPDVVLNKIGNRIEALNELTYDSHVASCIQSRKAGVLSHEWEISGISNDNSIKQFLLDIFYFLDLNKIISDILDAPYIGYRILEIIWRVENGKIIPVDIIGKPSEWFYFDYNNIPRFRTLENKDGLILSPRKFLVVQHNPSYNNPYGEALLSKCFWPVFYKKEEVKFWAIFSEKYGMPYLWGSTGFGGDAETLFESLEGLREDGIIVTEGGKEDINVNILDASKASSPDIYSNFINFLNSEISKALISQTLTTELQDKGSYAASQTHYQVRQDIIDSDKRLVENSINKLINWIIDINFGPITEKPIFKLYQEENVDLTLADRDSKLASTNQIRFTKEYWIRNYGFKEDEIEVIEPAPNPSFSENEIDQDQGFDKFAKSVEPMIMQIQDLITAGKSYDEISNLIIELYPKLNTEEIESNIAQAILLSNAEGQLKGKTK